MVALPAATPETIPVAEPTVAIEVLLLVHVPPEVALFSVTEAPTHVAIVPVMADGNGVTVTVVVTDPPNTV